MRATTSWEVGPAGLSTTMIPSELDGPRGGHAGRATGDEPLGDRQHDRLCLRQRRGDGRPGGARGPPPPQVPASWVASMPPSRVRMLRRVWWPASLNRMAISAVADWLSRSIRPSESDASLPVAARSASSSAAPYEAALRSAVQAGQDAAEELQLAVGLAAVQAPRRLVQRRACGQQLGRHAQRAGGRVGVLEGRCVDDQPGHEARRQLAVRGVEGNLQPGGQQRRHLARRGRRRVDPVHRAEARVGQVVVDVEDGDPPEQLGVVAQERPDTLQVTAVAHDDEVIGHAGLGCPAEAREAGHEVVHGRHGVGADGPALPPRASTSSAWASAEPSASASGFSWQTVSTRRASRSVATTASGTAATSVAVRDVRVTWRAARDEASARAAARVRRGPRWPASGSVSSGGSSVGSAWPASSSSMRWRTRVPRRTVSSSRRCSSGMRLRRSSPRRWRRNGMARPSARIASRRSAGCPMSETHTVACRRSGVTSTLLTVTNPIRGSWTSRAMRALSSSWSRRPDAAHGRSCRWSPSPAEG